MSDIKTLTLPIDEAAIRRLHVGDFVTLTGDVVLTAGLPTHQRMQDCIDRKEPLPIDITNGTFFHLGSYSEDHDGRFDVRYMNPTTSTRFNSYMPGFIRQFGLRMVGGKGGLDRASAEAMRDVGCVYLSFLGGGAALHTDAIRAVVTVAWPDLVSHYRLVKLRVEELGPLVVAIDSHGDSLYESLGDSAADKMPDILRDLDAGRAAFAGKG